MAGVWPHPCGLYPPSGDPPEGPTPLGLWGVRIVLVPVPGDRGARIAPIRDRPVAVDRLAEHVAEKGPSAAQKRVSGYGPRSRPTNRPRAPGIL